jgi:hypothetical protein
MTFRTTSTALALMAAFALGLGGAASTQTKRKPARRHAAPAAAAASPAATGGEAAGNGFGVAESISGKIQMVIPDQNLVVLSGPNGVPYDLKITPRTVIVVGEKRGTIESLGDQIGKTASVGFVPQRDGNYADRVEVTG